MLHSDRPVQPQLDLHVSSPPDCAFSADVTFKHEDLTVDIEDHGEGSLVCRGDICMTENLAW